MLDGFMRTPTGEREKVLLPTLTSFSFTGSLAILDGLIHGLAAPSLRELHISLSDLPGFYSAFLRAPAHITSFIRNAGRQFFSARFDTSKNAVNIVMSTHPDSTDGPPFRIVASGLYSISLIDELLSESLATVEDVILASPFDLKGSISPFGGPVQSYKFFKSFRNAKILRVSPGIEQGIGDIFHDEGLALDLLPSLEEIELNVSTPSRTPIRTDDNQVASALELELFKPFVDARQQAGQLVKVHWSIDRVLPGYFCDTDI